MDMAGSQIGATHASSPAEQAFFCPSSCILFGVFLHQSGHMHLKRLAASSVRFIPREGSCGMLGGLLHQAASHLSVLLAPWHQA